MYEEPCGGVHCIKSETKGRKFSDAEGNQGYQIFIL